jgi:microcystin-dependent protein
MSNPYIGEIRIFAGNFPPQGWAFCDGSLQSIAENDALFALIGTTYGGDGQTSFALPDLRGRLPVHQGAGTDQTYTLGEAGGVETVTLTTQQIPAHAHAFMGSSDTASTTGPTGAVPATMGSVTTFAYGADLPPAAFAPSMVAQAGGSQPHDNLQPYLVVSFIISLYGIFPSQN